MPDQRIVAQVASLVQDLGEQIVVWCKVHNDERVVAILDDPVQRDDGGVCRGDLVQRDLAQV